MKTRVIDVAEEADLDADPINCPQGHTSIERGAKHTGSGYWCGECGLRYVYRIVEQEKSREKVVRSKDVMEALSAAFESMKHQTLPVAEVGHAVYKKLLVIPEFHATELHSISASVSEKDDTSSDRSAGLSLCCGAPMVELLQMTCSNCGTDAETADNKCRHGVDLGTICEMCDYEKGDNGEHCVPVLG